MRPLTKLHVVKSKAFTEEEKQNLATQELEATASEYSSHSASSATTALDDSSDTMSEGEGVAAAVDRNSRLSRTSMSLSMIGTSFSKAVSWRKNAAKAAKKKEEKENAKGLTFDASDTAPLIVTRRVLSKSSSSQSSSRKKRGVMRTATATRVI